MHIVTQPPNAEQPMPPPHRIISRNARLSMAIREIADTLASADAIRFGLDPVEVRHLPESLQTHYLNAARVAAATNASLIEMRARSRAEAIVLSVTEASFEEGFKDEQQKNDFRAAIRHAISEYSRQLLVAWQEDVR